MNIHLILNISSFCTNKNKNTALYMFIKTRHFEYFVFFWNIIHYFQMCNLLEVKHSAFKNLHILFAWNVFADVVATAFNVTHLPKNTSVRRGDSFHRTA